MAKAKRRAADRRQVDALVAEYRRTGDTALRDKLIAQHLYLAQTAARKFAGLGESHDDLLQEGAMGLINAVDLYDPGRGVQFSTYATHLVEGQIRHYLRDRGKLIKQPAWVQELTSKIMRASDALTQELNRAPTVDEIAERVEAAPENVRRMLDARERSKVASLDAAGGEDDEHGPAIDPEKLSAENPGSIHIPVEDRIFLQEAMSRLKALERKVVHHFYFRDLNQTEIARKLGISVNYASYLLRGAVAKLKKAFEQEQARQAQAEETTERVEPYSISMRPAAVDPATNLATGPQFLDRLAQEVRRASRYPQQFSVLLVEPDQEGADGDQLAALARLLRTNIRTIDLAARMTPTRFALLLPHTGRESSVLAERVVRVVHGKLGEPAGEVTISAGVAVYPANGRGADDLLASAEVALSEAHERGGNCYVRAQAPANVRRHPQAAPG